MIYLCYMFDTFESYLTVGESAGCSDISVRMNDASSAERRPLINLLYDMNNVIEISEPWHWCLAAHNIANQASIRPLDASL